MTRLQRTALIVITLAPSAAMAHEGHGLDGWWHALSAVHLTPLAVALIALVLLGKHLWSRSQR